MISSTSVAGLYLALTFSLSSCRRSRAASRTPGSLEVKKWAMQDDCRVWYLSTKQGSASPPLFVVGYKTDVSAQRAGGGHPLRALVARGRRLHYNHVDWKIFQHEVPRKSWTNPIFVKTEFPMTREGDSVHQIDPSFQILSEGGFGRVAVSVHTNWHT